mgnify:CR=1 FL=1
MQAILKLCVQVEERVGSIYAELAQYPSADPELHTIWQAMAEDEVQHAYRIRVIADRLHLAGVSELNLDPDLVQSLFDRAGEILQEVQEQSLSVDEAIYASVELEDAFMQVHLNYGDAGGQPDLQTMFRLLAEEDRKHTAQLKAYLERMPDGTGLEFTEPD